MFDEHFEKAGLTELVTFRKSQQNTRIKRKLKDELGMYIEGLFLPYMGIC